MLEKPPVCVCGCDAGAAPSEGKEDDPGFAAPREPPNRLPPKPPVLAGCDDGAPEGPPPRLPNRLGVVPDDVLLPRAPNSGLGAGAPDVCALLEAGCWPPRFPKSDMVVVEGSCAVLIVLKTNDRVHDSMELIEELGPLRIPVCQVRHA
jgi:hypothetical protein